MATGDPTTRTGLENLCFIFQLLVVDRGQGFQMSYNVRDGHRV
jgi:hypothetical protein